MKKYNLLLGSLLAFSLVFSGCGGDGGGSSSQETSTLQITGIAQLGYISSGDVKLFELSDLNKSIATTTSSNSTTPSEAGRFTFANISLSSSKYYLVEISGGQDIDPNDDGVIESNEAVDLNGSVYSLAKGKDLASGDIRINALSDMAYQKLKNSLVTLDDAQIETALDATANEYLEDVNGDGIVDHRDILLFDPTKHANLSKKNYNDVLSVYVSQLHAGKDETARLTSLLFLDKPTIEIENGLFQEVPFTLTHTLTNAPEGLSVKWFIDNSELNSSNANITQDGVYDVRAQLSLGEKIVKNVSVRLIATTTTQIASVEVDVTKNSEVYVSSESNSSLTGTKIIIPKGALSENVTVIVKKSSINFLPTDNSISLSDVIVLEPSGLMFDVPVEVRIPYDENLDMSGRNIQIARHSQDGTIDYLSPLYIDEINHEVVFETEHFTDFELIDWTTAYGIPINNSKVLEDLEDITGLNYLDDEWVEILNTKIGVSDSKLNLYDIYLEYKSNKAIDDNITSGNYVEAYKAFFPDEKSLLMTDQLLGEYKEVFKMAMEYQKSIDAAEAVGGAQANIEEKATNLLMLKKHYKPIGSLLGVFPVYEVPNSMNIVGEYTSYIKDKAIQAVQMIDDQFKIKQVKEYFALRKLHHLHEIEEALEKTVGLKSSTDTTKYDVLEFRDVSDNIDSTQLIVNGWFEAGYSNAATYSYSPPEGYWKRLDIMYEFHENYKKIVDTLNYTDYKKEHADTLKNLILETKSLIKNNGKFIDLGAVNLKANSNVLIGDDLIISATPVVNSSDNYDIELTLMKEDPYIGNDTPVETITDTGISGSKTYRFTVPVTSTGSKSYYVKSTVTISNTNIKDYLFQSNSVSINVKDYLKEISVTSIDTRGYLDSNGDYIVHFAPKFTDNVKIPVTIVATLEGQTYNLIDGDFKILKEYQLSSELSRLRVEIIPSPLVRGTYIVSNHIDFLDVKTELDDDLKGIVDANEIAISLVEVSALNLYIGENREADIYEGATIEFSIPKASIYEVLYVKPRGFTNFNSINLGEHSTQDNYIYTYKYDVTGEYRAVILVKLLNGEELELRSSTIKVNSRNNLSPTVDAGNDQSVNAGTAVTLNADALDSDGSIASIVWTKVAGPLEINFSDDKSSTTSFVAPNLASGEDAIYSFEVFVKDNLGVTSSDIVNITVKSTLDTTANQKPVVSIGSDIDVYEGETVYLNATATDDGSISKIKWLKSSDLIFSNDTLSTSFIAPYLDKEDSRIYPVALVVWDDEGVDSTNMIEVNVLKTPDTISPIFTNGASLEFRVEENQHSVGTLSATDDNVIIYRLREGDSASFIVGSSSGTIIFKDAPDYETQSSYSFIAVAVDEAGNEETQVVTINILDVEEIDDAAPVFTSSSTFTAEENQNTVSGKLVATDEYAITYSIKDGDADEFYVTSDGGSMLFKESPDFETKSSYTFTAVATDESNNSTEQRVTITLIDVDDDPFVTTWKTDNIERENSSGSDQITVTLGTSSTDTITVDWGDNIIETDLTGTVTHTYETASIYTVKFYGNLRSFRTRVDMDKLLTVEEWGDTKWSSMSYMFYDCDNLAINTIDIPNTSNVYTMDYMFAYTDNFNDNIGDWNTSNVMTMHGTFFRALKFNQDINSWDVSSVGIATDMFSGAMDFNQSLNDWDTSDFLDTAGMFKNATSFNGQIANWDMSKVDTISYMFEGATAFNQAIGNWNISGVDAWSSFYGMFKNATTFNQDIGDWNTTNASQFSEMFMGAIAFNQDLNSWDTSNVTSMSSMFHGATSFNGNISGWDISGDLTSMFAGATSFNQDISTWNLVNTSSTRYMFANATAFNQNLNAWNMSNVTDSASMFEGATSFDGNVGSWNLSSMTNLNEMFKGAVLFNQDISAWNTSNVYDISGMFDGASAFNQNISSWNTSNVKYMSYTFRNAENFNQDIGDWDTSKVSGMRSTFDGAIAFDQDIGNWNVSNVRYLSDMFKGVTLSTANYSSMLIKWSELTFSGSGRYFSAGNSKYSADAVNARAIVDDYWKITDGGEE